jgi:hypothetical protein
MPAKAGIQAIDVIILCVFLMLLHHLSLPHPLPSPPPRSKGGSMRSATHTFLDAAKGSCSISKRKCKNLICTKKVGAKRRIRYQGYQQSQRLQKTLTCMV